MSFAAFVVAILRYACAPPLGARALLVNACAYVFFTTVHPPSSIVCPFAPDNKSSSSSTFLQFPTLATVQKGRVDQICLIWVEVNRSVGSALDLSGPELSAVGRK